MKESQDSLDGDVEGLGNKEPANGFLVKSVMIRTETRTLIDTLRRIDKGTMVLDPEFQRDFVWDLKKQSKLIESALLRIPLPVFYFAETHDGKQIVVDGLQRLTTFHRFMNNKFSLKELAFLDDLNSKRFYPRLPDDKRKLPEDDLPQQYKNRLEDTQLTLYLIDAKVDDAVRCEIFDRVNGGIPLTYQQMRNCLHSGKATRFLRDMAEQSDFTTATHNKLNKKTMRDREFVNRFVAFNLLEYPKYDGNMQNFLGKALDELNKRSDVEVCQIGESFLKSMRVNGALFGECAFCRAIGDDDKNRHLNASLFDVLSVEFAQWDETSAVSRKDQIRERLISLLKDETFNVAITKATEFKTNVQTRFRKVEQSIGALRHD
jgi:hypothetical protein